VFDGCDYNLSIHTFAGSGHSGADFINLTHGSTEYGHENMIVSNVTDDYCFQVANYPGSSCCYTSSTNDCDNLGGTTNPQGIFINNSAYPGQWIQAEIDSDMTPLEDAYTMFIDNSALFFNSLNIDQLCVINGCTDITACNYDADATQDDGDSCIYDDACIGCTDPYACNYDPYHTIEDGSCDYSCYGCMDETACNYDADATLDDDSCDWVCGPDVVLEFGTDSDGNLNVKLKTRNSSITIIVHI
jgi:hypothetical protein